QDGSVKLWDAVSGHERGHLKPSQYPVWVLAFSPGGRTLAAGTDPIQLWDADAWSDPPLPNAAPAPDAERGKSLLPALTTAELERLLAELAGADAAAAYRSQCALITSSSQAASFLGDRLQPVAALPAERQRQLDRWLRDLDDDRFAVREQAVVELEQQGESAMPALRQALAGQPS